MHSISLKTRIIRRAATQVASAPFLRAHGLRRATAGCFMLSSQLTFHSSGLAKKTAHAAELTRWACATTMQTYSSLPQALQMRLRAELKLGESIVWAGQPDSSRYMRSGFKIWYFFIPWTLFSLFWIAAASGFKLPSFDEGWSLFPFFGLPFLLTGLAGLCSPFWMRRSAKSIIYAITNQRAITIEGLKTIKVRSFAANDISNIERTEHEDGSGDLVLKTEQHRDSDGDTSTTRYGFFAIENVRNVEKILNSLTPAAHA